jgi:hypothetical protein
MKLMCVHWQAASCSTSWQWHVNGRGSRQAAAALAFEHAGNDDVMLLLMVVELQLQCFT